MIHQKILETMSTMMNNIKIIKKEIVNKTQLGIEVILPKKYMDTKISDAIEMYKKITNINGFRTGKAPSELVYRKQKYQILDEAYHSIMSDLSKLVKKENPEVIRVRIKKEFIDQLENTNEITVEVIADKISKIDFPDIKKIKVDINDAKKQFEKSLEEVQKDAKREDEYHQLKEHSEEYIEHFYEDLIMKSLLESINISKDSIPQYIIEDYISGSIERISKYAENINMDYKTYLTKVNQSEEKLKSELEKEVINKIKLELLVDSTPDEYKPKLEQTDIQKELEYIKVNRLNNTEASDIIYGIIRNKTVENLVNTIKIQKQWQSYQQ